MNFKNCPAFSTQPVYAAAVYKCRYTLKRNVIAPCSIELVIDGKYSGLLSACVTTVNWVPRDFISQMCRRCAAGLPWLLRTGHAVAMHSRIPAVIHLWNLQLTILKCRHHWRQRRSQFADVVGRDYWYSRALFRTSKCTIKYDRWAGAYCAFESWPVASNIKKGY